MYQPIEKRKGALKMLLRDRIPASPTIGTSIDGSIVFHHDCKLWQ
jgi:hypothetical protein